MSQYLTGERIARDGKSIKSTVSSSQETEQNFVSLVSVFSQHRTLILKVGVLENHQTSDIPVVQELLNQFEITPTVVTDDAWHCQKNTVPTIVESGNSYVITVKPNQPKLYASIVKQTQMTKPRSSWSWTQTGHGHEVKCRLQVYPAPTEMQSSWTGLQRVISVNRRGERDGKSFDTTTYYISSETSRAYIFAPTLRGHRQRENHRHWVKEVIFKEDHCGIRLPKQAATLGVFRNFAFNLLVLEGFHSLYLWDTNRHRPEWSIMGDDNYPHRKILHSRHQLTVLTIYMNYKYIFYFETALPSRGVIAIFLPICSS
jgi:predicted transposase YbfD/YdcC